MIYFDYAANTPVDEEVLTEFTEITRNFYGNPNSFHRAAEEALNIIEKAEESIRRTLSLKDEEIIFTSGATESNNLALFGAARRYRNQGRHILFGSFEHNSITAPLTALSEEGFEVEVIPVGQDGKYTVEELMKHVREDTILISISAVDSELGIRQDVELIGEALKDRKCVFHVDASQAIGRTHIDFENIDLVTISPHKFYGLKSSGMLIRKQKVGLKPLIVGGRSTTVFRSGTPDPAMCACAAMALEKAERLCDERTAYAASLKEKFINGVAGMKTVKINTTAFSLPYTINFSIMGKRADMLVELLNERDIIVSAKSSCCPKNTPSKLIYALTKDRARAYSSVRISLSHLNTAEEVDTLLSAIKEIA